MAIPNYCVFYSKTESNQIIFALRAPANYSRSMKHAAVAAVQNVISGFYFRNIDGTNGQRLNLNEDIQAGEYNLEIGGEVVLDLQGANYNYGDQLQNQQVNKQKVGQVIYWTKKRKMKKQLSQIDEKDENIEN